MINLNLCTALMWRVLLVPVIGHSVVGGRQWRWLVFLGWLLCMHLGALPLFALALDPFLRCLIEKLCPQAQIRAYADDMAIVVKSLQQIHVIVNAFGLLDERPH